MNRSVFDFGNGQARYGGGLRAALGLFAALLCFAVFPTFAAADDGPDFSTYLTVKWVPGTTSHERLVARQSVDASFEYNLAAPGLQQVSVPSNESVADAAQQLRADDNIDYVVEPGEYKAESGPTPYFNDEFLPQQYALNNYGQVFLTRYVNGQFSGLSGTAGDDIDANDAWAVAQTQNPVASEQIGIVDTGVAYDHPDLAANMETGYDFYDDDSDPRDFNGHGTHVASLAGGVADNGIGIAGVDPWAKLMPLRAADEFGTFSWAAIGQAVSYGLDHGVRVFNGSFGGPDDDPAFEDLMASNPQALFIFSAGNGGSDQIGDNHDIASGAGHRFPCDSTLDNVICVGSSDWNDALSKFSDFGTTSVDLVAPGSSIYGAKPCTVAAQSNSPSDTTECPYSDDPTQWIGLGGGTQAFQLLSGTSMSAPQVSGTAALVWQQCPSLQPSQVKAAIVDNVTPVASMSSKIAYGGRLDAGRTMQSVSSCPAPSDGTDWPQPPAPTGPGTDGGGTGPTGDGGSDGGTSSNPGGTVTVPSGKGLVFSIVRPRVARIGRSSSVKFKLKCSAACSAKYTVTINVRGLKKFAGKVAASTHSGTRAVAVKIPSGRLKALRALLSSGIKPKLKFSLVAADKTGAKSSPVVFTVPLSK